MVIDNILKFFLPKESKFFELFAESGKNMEATALKLKELAQCVPSERGALIKAIDTLEHVGDKITHNIIYELNSTFITPIDREDIHKLASAMDDVVDHINLSAYSTQMYNLQELPPAYGKLCDILVESSKLISEATSIIKNPKEAERVREICLKLNIYENDADGVYVRGITDLFAQEKDPVQIIKIKDTLSALELATDKVEDVANLLETIIIKTA